MTDVLISSIKEAILPELRLIIQEENKKQSLQELQEKFLSIDEARKLFNPIVSRGTLYNWMDAGLIESYSIGGKRYFKYSELIESIQKIKKYKRS